MVACGRLHEMTPYPREHCLWLSECLEGNSPENYKNMDRTLVHCRCKLNQGTIVESADIEAVWLDQQIVLVNKELMPKWEAIWHATAVRGSGWWSHW